MFVLENDLLALVVSADASVIEVHDRRRGCVWALDAGLAGYRRDGEQARMPFPPGAVTCTGQTVTIS
jgi:hypothetical protein